MRRNILLVCTMFALLLPALALRAQVTTGAMSGTVTMKDGKPISGARVTATHLPSGTKYGSIVGATGRYAVPNLRTGGPYTVEISAIGMKAAKFGDITIQLGQTYVLDVKLDEGEVKLSEITITSKKGSVMSNERTGAATNINRDIINAVPTLNRNILDFTKMTPQAGRGNSFGGQDNRMNNLTIDGSVFNNTFGLANTPGGQTGQSPISLDAIEEVQVNIAPYDVRQGGFTGAGVNAVTRSGDNEWRWSVFTNTRNQGFAGDSVAGAKATDGLKIIKANNQYQVLQFGGRLSGPIIENKLFFFLNYERETNVSPMSNYRAAQPGEAATGAVTRVQASTLDSLRQFLINKYQYDPGIYDNVNQPYNRTTFGDKATGKLTWNIDETNKASIRFQYLRSQSDVILNSGSNAVGNRNGNNNALNFANSNYGINNDIYSAVAELNSVFSSSMSNNLIVGFTANRDYRSSPSRPFPMVDILQGGSTLTSFGYELFTPFNKLDTDTWQLQDNVTIYSGDHTITAGVSFEAFRFVNGFNQRYYGYYRFNSLQDFYNSANGVKVPIRVNGRDSLIVAQPVQFSQTYSALKDGSVPLAETRAYQASIYGQDEWNISSTFKATIGLRIDAPIFDQSTALANSVVSDATFYNNVTNNSSEKLSTGNLPSLNPLFSPRVGINWDVNGDRSLQVRGGTGIFSGRPPFVWLSNVVTNNGVSSGEILQNSPLNRQFNPDPNAYIPANASSSVPAATFTVNTVVPGFRFPQLWRSNLAADIQLPLGLIATVEGIHSKYLAQVYYRDANLRPATAAFTGVDNRPRFPGSFITTAGAARDSAIRLNYRINGNYVLDNTDAGDSWSGTVQIQKPFSDGWFAMVAYTYSVARDITSAGSIAANSWNANPIVASPNLPTISYSDNDNPHRLIASASYRFDFGEVAALTLSGFYELRTQGRFSYTYSGDMNGDGVSNNDLIFVPKNKEDVVLVPFTAGGKTWSADDQWTALDKFISSDPYLSTRRGQYSERNGGLRGWLSSLDIAATLDVNFMIGEKKNTVQIRADVINGTNILNPSLGVGDRVLQNGASRPLLFVATRADGVPTYRLNETAAGAGLAPSVLTNSLNFPGDVWQFQLGIRYIFN